MISSESKTWQLFLLFIRC